jgi:hypothetical protein
LTHAQNKTAPPPKRGRGAPSFRTTRTAERAAVVTFKSDNGCQRQRLSVIRRGVATEISDKSKIYVRAVPTGDAHRLPKSVAYVSALSSRVKGESAGKIELS